MYFYFEGVKTRTSRNNIIKKKRKRAQKNVPHPKVYSEKSIHPQYATFKIVLLKIFDLTEYILIIFVSLQR